MLAGTRFWQQRGATILELVVLLTLLGVSMPAILSLLSSLYVRHAEMQIRFRALELAQQQMEAIRFFRDSHWDWFQRISEMEKLRVPAGDYRIAVSVKPYQTDDHAVPLWQVTVQVGHPSLKKPVALEMYLARYQKPGEE